MTFLDIQRLKIKKAKFDVFTCRSTKQYWDFISEISYFGKFGGKYRTDNPNEVLRNSHFWVLFSKPPSETLWHCWLWLRGTLKKMKMSTKWWKWVIFEVLFVRFCPQISNHTFSLFFTFDSWHCALWVWKPCVFSCVFRAFYMYFGRLGLISDPGLELEGGL